MGGEKKPAKATKFKGTKDAKATRGAFPGAAPRALASARIAGLASRTLRQCRQFYVTYPGMWQALSAKSQGGLPLPGFWQTLSAELPIEQA